LNLGKIFMMRTLCKSKIHGATVTQTELEYEGSITLPPELIKKANLLPYERVQVVNLNNGSRIETYVIEGKAGSSTICLNGPAARAAVVGDRIHIISYALVGEEETSAFSVRLLYLDRKNKISKSKDVALRC
jgi:aspartate 1-decarboxylase